MLSTYFINSFFLLLTALYYYSTAIDFFPKFITGNYYVCKIMKNTSKKRCNKVTRGEGIQYGES